MAKIPPKINKPIIKATVTNGEELWFKYINNAKIVGTIESLTIQSHAFSVRTFNPRLTACKRFGAFTCTVP